MLLATASLSGVVVADEIEVLYINAGATGWITNDKSQFGWFCPLQDGFSDVYADVVAFEWWSDIVNGGWKGPDFTTWEEPERVTAYLGNYVTPAGVSHNDKYYTVVALDASFFGCVAESIELPCELRYVFNASFKYSQGFSELTLPASVVYVGGQSLRTVYDLEDLYMLSPLPPVAGLGPDRADSGMSLNVGAERRRQAEEYSPYGGNEQPVRLHVPSGCGWFYSLNPAYGVFASVEEDAEPSAGELYTDDGLLYRYMGNGEVQLYGVETLPGRSVSVPSTIPTERGSLRVTSIGGGAFEGLAELEGITLPESLEVICGRAFKGTSLHKVWLPSGMRYCGPEAFGSLNGLETVSVSASQGEEPLFFAPDAFAGSREGATLIGKEKPGGIDMKEKPWSGFGHIKTPLTGVEPAVGGGVEIKAVGGRVLVSSSGEVSVRVYALDGRLMASALGAEVELSLEAGCYIVEAGGRTARVMLAGR